MSSLTFFLTFASSVPASFPKGLELSEVWCHVMQICFCSNVGPGYTYQLFW